MQWEIEIIKYIQTFQNGFFDVFFWLFSFFASYLGIIIIFIFLYFFSNKKYATFFLIFTVINVVLNYVLKIIINRQRPYEVSEDIINMVKALGQSFPSGHMVCATSIVFFLFAYIYNKYKNTKYIAISLSIFVFYLICVALSRMYFGQHFLTDIIAGMCVALILCFVEFKIFKKYIKY